MKKLKYITIIFLMLIPFIAQGQQNASVDKHSKMQAHGLKSKFSLSDSQTAQCEQIIKKYAAELSETYKPAGDSTQKIKKREQLLQKRDQELKAVFTKEQAGRFDTWKKEKQRHNGKAVKNEDVKK